MPFGGVIVTIVQRVQDTPITSDDFEGHFGIKRLVSSPLKIS